MVLLTYDVPYNIKKVLICLNRTLSMSQYCITVKMQFPEEIISTYNLFKILHWYFHKSEWKSMCSIDWMDSQELASHISSLSIGNEVLWWNIVKFSVKMRGCYARGALFSFTIFA